jgi:hypothetical protein
MRDFPQATEFDTRTGISWGVVDGVPQALMSAGLGAVWQSAGSCEPVAWDADTVEGDAPAGDAQATWMAATATSRTSNDGDGRRGDI